MCWNKEVNKMGKKGIRVTTILCLCLFSVACSGAQRLLLGMAGLQGQMDSLTQVAVPIQRETPTPIGTISATQAETPQPQVSPTSVDADSFLGVWTGTAQWQCENNPVWSISLDFKENGSVSATVTFKGEVTSADAAWVRTGDSIELQFITPWTGTISGNTMNGTIADENCAGNWSASKKQ
jgi:hypothetical protein